MESQLWEMIYKLPKENIVNLLFEALDEMQSSNTRSRSDCILLAIGATRESLSFSNPVYLQI